MRVEVKTEAEEEARGAILLQAIAEREGITVGDADVQKRIAELAAARNENPKQLRAELEKDHRIHQLETQIREQKTLDLLISQAKITDGEPAPSLIVTPEQAAPGDAAAGKAKKTPSRPSTRKRNQSMSQFDAPPPAIRTSSSRRSSSRPTGASAAGTSSRACSRTGSSSWARRSTTRSPTSSSPSCCSSRARTRTRTSCSTSTRRAGW